ncbi:hypothetical protein DL770_008388 [Monosporascus sp. CRB-9-2]|nr:hypothetical protein DL770_008388 [Monosporascus sp. CRB-9-2]
MEAVREVCDTAGDVPLRPKEQDVADYFAAQGVEIPARGWDEGSGHEYSRSASIWTGRIYGAYSGGDNVADDVELAMESGEAEHLAFVDAE